MHRCPPPVPAPQAPLPAPPRRGLLGVRRSTPGTAWSTPWSTSATCGSTSSPRILVGLVGSGIPLGLAEKVTLIFCVLLVFFAEILNSALEQLVDLADPAVRREGAGHQGRRRRRRAGAGHRHGGHLRRDPRPQLADGPRQRGRASLRQVLLRRAARRVRGAADARRPRPGSGRPGLRRRAGALCADRWPPGRTSAVFTAMTAGSLALWPRRAARERATRGQQKTCGHVIGLPGRPAKNCFRSARACCAGNRSGTFRPAQDASESSRRSPCACLTPRGGSPPSGDLRRQPGPCRPPGCPGRRGRSAPSPLPITWVGV